MVFESNKYYVEENENSGIIYETGTNVVLASLEGDFWTEFLAGLEKYSDDELKSLYISGFAHSRERK